uniref:ATPase subunit 8 n=1 Tax=Neuroctenus yunnanensis TaxID=2813420 RepID=A0A8T9W2D0_9HEMI|nr:ATPase subunit 8 [Neuroctenus yunnanensis]YP_010990153.1 ATP synthase F0 subunit 8 [Neuroctenus taiwanicus]UPI55393.1 ATPase subunit 8 [Neuroctenus yunnanensis]WOW95749.1 ATP synthase F0 subunit 8 [Neuroctenus taiwanicus]
MPHMSPMWWMMLYLTFITCMIMLMSTIYFYFIPKGKKNKMEKVINTNNWKW